MKLEKESISQAVLDRGIPGGLQAFFVDMTAETFMSALKINALSYGARISLEGY